MTSAIKSASLPLTPRTQATEKHDFDVQVDTSSNHRDARTRPIVNALSWLGGISGVLGIGSLGVGMFAAAEGATRGGVIGGIGGVLGLGIAAGAFLGAAEIARQN